MPRYAGRVNCIYIDPPYNTGNEKWLYNDNVNSPMMQNWLKGKSPVDGEDLERHDKWLCMMWPRLQLLRELLAEDGVIFISIDDNEQHRLRMMMDEIFGEENFIADFVWNSTKSITNPALVSVSHTHNITYAKQLDVLKSHRSNFKLPAILEGFSNLDNDPRGDWKADPFEVGGVRPNQMYPIKNPKTKEIFYPAEGNCWKNDLNRFKGLLADNRIVFGKKGSSKPQRKRFLSEARQRGLTSNTWWDDVGTTTNGTTELKTLLNSKSFSNPKPVSLIHKILQLATTQNAIVLDSFAGSGTTAHAVLALNKEDGGNRKFILVECEDYAHKITAERVRRVIKGVPKSKDENLKNGLGGTFTYCTLGDEISIEKMLTGKHLPDYETFARHLVYVATGKSPDKIRKARGKDGFFFETPDRLFYLIYEPKLTFLRSVDSALNGDRAERIAKQAKTKKKPALVFATHKFMGQKELTNMNIAFCQLPYGAN